MRMDTCMFVFSYKTPVSCTGQLVTPASKYGCQSQMLSVCVAKEDQDNTANL